MFRSDKIILTHITGCCPSKKKISGDLEKFRYPICLAKLFTCDVRPSSYPGLLLFVRNHGDISIISLEDKDRLLRYN